MGVYMGLLHVKMNVPLDLADGKLVIQYNVHMGACLPGNFRYCYLAKFTKSSRYNS